MNYRNIDYTIYLSIDNGRGLLLSKDDIEILKKYGFDFNSYSDIRDLLVDLNNYCDDGYEEDDLEEIIQRVSEIYYYNYVNK